MFLTFFYTINQNLFVRDSVVAVCACVCVCAHSLSHVWFFVAPWTVVLQLLCPWDFPGKNTGAEWVAIFFSRGSSWPRNQTHVSWVSCIGRWILYHWHHLGSPRRVRNATIFCQPIQRACVWEFPLKDVIGSVNSNRLLQTFSQEEFHIS